MQPLSCVRNLGDPGKVKGMFKPKSSLTTRSGAFFSWKSDESIVAKKCGNAHGAKGFTKGGLHLLNLIVDIEPKLWGSQ